MGNDSTDVSVRQGFVDVHEKSPSQAALGARCTFCWVIKTGLTKDGRFISFRVFCHHHDCPEWRAVKARLLAAPIFHWDTLYYGELNQQEWEHFKNSVGLANWVGVPSAGGGMIVWSNEEVSGCGLNCGGRQVGLIEQALAGMPEGARVRRPRELEQVREKEGLAVDVNLEFAFRGLGVELLEEACAQAGVQVHRYGPYRDCIESVAALSEEQQGALQQNLYALQRAYGAFRGSQ